MAPHPSHKIVQFKILYDEIQYCTYCRLYTTAPEIEQPCKNRISLLEKLLKQESRTASSRTRPLRP
ncbi:hypothetical protein KEJ39_08975 [Candidatus Bathyarchaeota archaeon]|nr:hypothetical protein [Candidatus Bathyarchaeota archaeon]